jgi:hypothetical protein
MMMRKMVLLVLFLMLGGFGSLLAETIAIGDPVPLTGSWSQNWLENGIWGDFDQPYNRIVVTMLTGSLESLDVSGWNVVGSQASIPGTAYGNLNWTTTFAGNSSQPVQFQYDLYYNNILLGTQVLTWSGSAWSDPAMMVVAHKVPVPEPTLACLLIIGCVGFGMASLRLKKQD